MSKWPPTKIIHYIFTEDLQTVIDAINDIISLCDAVPAFFSPEYGISGLVRQLFGERDELRTGLTGKNSLEESTVDYFSDYHSVFPTRKSQQHDRRTQNSTLQYD